MFVRLGTLALLLSTASVASPPLPTGPQLIAPSERAVAGAFRFRDVEGNRFTLADLQSRPVVIELWATWCVPCIDLLPEIAALQSLAAGKKHLSVIPVHLDKKGWIVVTPFLFRAGLRERGFKTYAADSPSQIDSAFGPLRSLPTTILIDSQGRIAARWTGFRPSGNPLKALLEELLREAPPGVQ